MYIYIFRKKIFHSKFFSAILFYLFFFLKKDIGLLYNLQERVTAPVSGISLQSLAFFSICVTFKLN